MADTVLNYEYDPNSQTYTVAEAISIADDGVVIIPETYDDNINGEHQVARIGWKAFQNNNKIKKVTCNVRFIGNQAFASTNLTYVDLGENLESIGIQAFYGCWYLKSVTIPNGVTSIGDYAFSGCRNLSDIVIPNGVTSIGVSAFQSCEELVNITIPNSITNIGNSAFADCSSLTSVTMPDSITSIGHNVFARCNNLVTINFPKGLDYIGESAFCETSLIQIVFPSSLEMIDSKAFQGCDKLERVFIFSGVETIGSDAFKDSPNLTIYCQAESKPQNWNELWKPQECPVFWGVGKEAANFDTDYLGFTFKGMHSYLDFGVLRTINDRMQLELSPEKNDITADNPGGNGSYYFGSHHKSRKFNIDFAFDHLTEKQLREWKRFCSNEELGDLIFDEEPYKVYTAKITGQPSLKVIPFVIEGARVYRGEGSIEFTCYWPYAHTPNAETKVSKKFMPDGKFILDGRILDQYLDFIYTNKDEWKETSMLTDHIDGANPGDLPAPFILKASSISGMTDQSHLTFKVGAMEVTIPAATVTTSYGTNTYTHYRDIKWDSKTGIVSGRKITDAPGEEKPIRYTGNSLGTIPVGENSGFVWGLKQNTTPVSYSTTNLTLEYDYWYY